MRPEDMKYFHALSADRIGGETVFLEAGGESTEGKVAVAWVVKNRVDHPSFQGNDVATVCFHQAAFSCYLSVDNPEYLKARAIAQNFDAFADPKTHVLTPFKWGPADAGALFQCLAVFRDVWAGRIPSPFSTGDVFMYYAQGSPKPSWADKLQPASPAQIGKHLFYRGR